MTSIDCLLLISLGTGRAKPLSSLFLLIRKSQMAMTSPTNERTAATGTRQTVCEWRFSESLKLFCEVDPYADVKVCADTKECADVEGRV